MGMINSYIKVVPDITRVSNEEISSAGDTSGQSGTVGGGCCG
jgi:hypothetical protein